MIVLKEETSAGKALTQNAIREETQTRERLGKNMMFLSTSVLAAYADEAPLANVKIKLLPLLN